VEEQCATEQSAEEREKLVKLLPLPLRAQLQRIQPLQLEARNALAAQVSQPLPPARSGFGEKAKIGRLVQSLANHRVP